MQSFTPPILPCSQRINSIFFFSLQIIVLVLGLPVPKTAAACVLWLAVGAAGAAAERTGHVAVGMKNESRRGDAADEKRGLFLHTQAATSLAAP